MRLIDATPLECQAKEGMGNEWNHRAAPTSWAHAEERFLNRIEDAPTVDAVPVVRCKDCASGMVSDNNKYIICCDLGVSMGFDDYCSNGKRKENKDG